MALLNIVGGHVRVEMVDMVVFYPSSEGLQDQWDLQISATLKGSSGEIPCVFSFAVGHVDRVLKMEQNCAQNLSDYCGEHDLIARDAEQGKDAKRCDKGTHLSGEGFTENSVSFGNSDNQPYKPDKGRSEQEEDDRLPENPDQNSSRTWPSFVLPFGEENSLRKIKSVQISEMFVMMVVAVPPGLEGEVHINSDQSAENPVQGYAFEKREMSHIMELDEEPDCVQSLQSPPQHPKSIPDQIDNEGLNSKRCAQSSPSQLITRLAVAPQILFEPLIFNFLWIDGLLCEPHSFYWLINSSHTRHPLHIRWPALALYQLPKSLLIIHQKYKFMLCVRCKQNYSVGSAGIVRILRRQLPEKTGSGSIVLAQILQIKHFI